MWADIEGSGGSFTWKTSGYKKELVDEFKITVPSSGRKWTPGSRGYGRSRDPGYWTVAAQYWQPVIDLCGRFDVSVDIFGSVTEVQTLRHRIELDYMGLVRPRDGGLHTASGWVNGGWNAVFTLAVLQDWFNFTLNPGDMPTLFSTLGVDESLTGLAFDKALKKAYRRAARTWHPDVNKDVEAEQRMRELNAAFEVLSNPILREDYDGRRSYGGFVASEPISDSGFASTVPASQPRSLAAMTRGSPSTTSPAVV